MHFCKLVQTWFLGELR